jgi:hypothetical protein
MHRGLALGMYRYAPSRLRICKDRGYIATALYRQGTLEDTKKSLSNFGNDMPPIMTDRSGRGTLVLGL